MFPEYKAQRKKMEEEFTQQIPWVQDLIKRLHIPSVLVPWYEADDSIATLVRSSFDYIDICLYIYSSDKDLKQLLTDRVICVDPLKDTQTTYQSFLQEYGFAPEYMVDYLALIGDTADNIPWVKGIGPKKASELIQKYHTLDNLYAHIDELSEDLKQKLLTSKQDVYRGKSLIALSTVPDLVSVPWEQYVLSFDFDLYKRILVEECGFRSFDKLIDELKTSFSMPTQASLF